MTPTTEAPSDRAVSVARRAVGVALGLGCDASEARHPRSEWRYASWSAAPAADWAPEQFDHVKTGFQLDDNHKDTGCKDCHVDGMGKAPRCNACHDDDWKYPAKAPGKKL